MKLATRILNIINEAKADRYLAMFKDPSEEVKSFVKEVVQRLKKDDRIVWMLKLYRDHDFQNYIILQDSSPKGLAKYYSGLMDSLEHYYSLPINDIQNYVLKGNNEYNVLDDFKEFEKDWKKARKGEIADEDEKKSHTSRVSDFITFPDGWKWVEKLTAYCSIEGDAMGHCGNEPRENTDDIMFSLREPTNRPGIYYPHVTAILDKKYNIREMVGRENKKPIPKYYPYIIELLKNDVVKKLDTSDAHEPEKNFKLIDLSVDQLKKLGSKAIKLCRNNEDKARVKAKINNTTGEIKVRDFLGIFEDGELVGSAETYFDGSRRWFDKNGLLYRSDGLPSVERANGTKEWWVDGRKHREDGPAIENADGTKKWYLDDRKYTEADYHKEMARRNAERGNNEVAV